MQKSAIITVVLLVFIVVFVIGWNSIENVMSNSPLLSNQREFIQEVTSEPETPIVTTTVFVLGTDVQPSDIIDHFGCRINGDYSTSAFSHGATVIWEDIKWACDVGSQVYRDCDDFYNVRHISLIKITDDVHVYDENVNMSCLVP